MSDQINKKSDVVQLNDVLQLNEKPQGTLRFNKQLNPYARNFMDIRRFGHNFDVVIDLKNGMFLGVTKTNGKVSDAVVLFGKYD